MTVFRAWWAGHDASAVCAIFGALSVLLAAGARVLLPVPGNVPALPLWQMTPALFAMVAAGATVSRLPQTRAPGRAAVRRLALARLAWMIAVTAAAGAAVTLVDRTRGLPPLAPATMALVLATFGAAVALGRGAAWLGAAACGAVLARAPEFAGAANPWSPDAPWVGIIAAVVAGASLILYPVYGGRGPFTSPKRSSPYSCPHG